MISKSKSYSIHITSKAQKDIRKLDSKVRSRIITAILRLKTNRYPQQFKPISGKQIAQFRLRVGDYRILYDVYNHSKTVLILRIGHRKDIYR